MSNIITIDLEDDARRALDRLAQQTNRSVDEIVNQAVRNLLNLQEWQRRKIEAGTAAAERAEFATEEELDRIAGKYHTRRWGSRGRRPPLAALKTSETTSPARIRALRDELFGASMPGANPRCSPLPRPSARIRPDTF